MEGAKVLATHARCATSGEYALDLVSTIALVREARCNAERSHTHQRTVFALFMVWELLAVVSHERVGEPRSVSWLAKSGGHRREVVADVVKVGGRVVEKGHETREAVLEARQLLRRHEFVTLEVVVAARDAAERVPAILSASNIRLDAGRTGVENLCGVGCHQPGRRLVTANAPRGLRQPGLGASHRRDVSLSAVSMLGREMSGKDQASGSRD